MNKLFGKTATLVVGTLLAVGLASCANSSSLSARVAKATDFTDTITYALYSADMPASGYGDFSGKSVTGGSPAVYAGQSTKNNNSLVQLRATNPSGIVTTASGGILKSVSFTFDASTSNGRKIDIYAKGTAYTSGADLYDNSKAGTKVFTGEKSATDLEFTYNFEEGSNYKNIGIRSNSGALYLTSITIVWEEYVAPVLNGIAVTTQPTKTAYEVEDHFDPAGMVVTASYADGSSADVTSSVTYEDKALTVADNKVELSYTEGTVTKTVDVAISVAAVTQKAYSKVNEFVAGTYIIAATYTKDEVTHTVAALPETASNRLKWREYSLAEGKIVTKYTDLLWTFVAVEGEEGFYHIKTSDGKYLSAKDDEAKVFLDESPDTSAKKLSNWKVEFKDVTYGEGQEAETRTVLSIECSGKSADNKNLIFNPGYGFSSYVLSKTSITPDLYVESGDAPTPTPPTPTPTPTPAKKGCGGDIATISVILSAISLAGVGLLLLKKRVKE